MDIKDIRPRSGRDSLRIGDSNDLVVIDHFIGLPAGRIRPLDHGIIIICTAGTAKFVYDGQPIELNKDDLFLFMAHSVVEKFESSGDFDCRELWFSRGELWNMNMYIKSSLADILPLKHNPKVALSPTEVALFDVYFQQICQHMRNSSLIGVTPWQQSIPGEDQDEQQRLAWQEAGRTLPATGGTERRTDTSCRRICTDAERNT